MEHAISWFEIPVKDYNRAKAFYTTVLGTEITDHHMSEKNMKYGVFSHSKDHGVGGAIIEGEGQTPTAEGATVYLNGGNDLGLPLSRVERLGGKILMPKTSIDEDGYIAQFLDTEGNRIALYSKM